MYHPDDGNVINKATKHHSTVILFKLKITKVVKKTQPNFMSGVLSPIIANLVIIKKNVMIKIRNINWDPKYRLRSKG